MVNRNVNIKKRAIPKEKAGDIFLKMQRGHNTIPHGDTGNGK